MDQKEHILRKKIVITDGTKGTSLVCDKDSLDKSCIKEFKRILRKGRSKIGCPCCNNKLCLQNMANHLLTNLRCKRMKTKNFQDREGTSVTLGKLWEAHVGSGGADNKVKCEFCPKIVLKSSLEDHLRDNKRCLARREFAEKGKRTGLDRLLKNAYPEVYEQIHPTLNGELNKGDLTYGSNLDLWWFCNESTCHHQHIWQTQVITRTYAATGCPFCNGSRICPCNSVFALYPELKKEFDFSKNKDLDLDTIPPGSQKEVWWTCSIAQCSHHKWYASFADRASKGSGCPFCSHGKTCPCDSFAAIFPDAMKDFTEEKNKGISLLEVAPGNSSMDIAWKCHICGWEWKTTCSERSQGHGCRKCGLERVKKAISYTQEQFITIAVEVHGNTYDYSMVKYKNSTTPVLIICKIHGPFPLRPIYHTSQKTGCSKCRSSKLERKTSAILVSLEIEFEEQKSFPDCRLDLPLKFDKYIRAENAAIELDGYQHFDPDNHFHKGSRWAFERVQVRDAIKNDYCKAKSINFLRISHSEECNLEDHIIRFLKDAKSAKDQGKQITYFAGKEYNGDHRGIMTCTLDYEVKQIVLFFLY